MSEQRQHDDQSQPVRARLVRKTLERPPLDWGDEEPDAYWEDLYHRGLVDPPYRTPGKARRARRQSLDELPPLAISWPTDEMLSDLGRSPGEDCTHGA